MENDIAGVRIDPPVVEFVDAGANVLHSIVITVQNISKSSKVLKFHRPTTNNFRLKVRNPDKPIAPGLELKATIEYFTDVPKDCHDRVILLVDDDVIEIPLFAYCPQPLLELEGPVDFGAVTANHRVLSKEISLYNHGSVSGDFKIKYDGPQPIVILPNSGTVRPKTAQIIKIEFVTKTPGTLAEEAKVKLEGQEPCTLCIKAEVVQRSLELFSIETQQHLHCVKFGETYYGTDRTEGAILYNNGPDPVSFVTIMQVGAIGEELGTDLSKSTAAMLSTVDKSSTDTKDMTSLFTAIPNQGVLGPYQQLPVFFRFSPRFNSSKQGWKGNVNIAPRQDYAIFVNIEMVGSNDGFADTEDKTENGNRCKVELALTGTALPVLINVSPQSQYDFGECQIGEHVDTLCTLKNESTVLPVSFVLRPIAQFASSPPVGKLLPGQTRDVIFSFKPNQYGGFKKIQYLDILGPVADDHIVTGTHLAPIHTIHIALSGVSNPQTTKRQPKFNPGITPLVVGEVGQFVDVTFDRAKPYDPRAATLNAVGSKGIHVSKSATQTRDDMTLVSYPNDMARSVRPSYRRDNYATIFTKNERYTYVDPDYAFTDEELAARKDHRDYYVNYIKDLREQRQAKEKSLEFNELNNETDIGLKPASGLKSPQPKVDQIKEKKKAPVSANGHFKMLSTKRLAEAENAATSRPVSDGLNAVPMSKQEKHDCKIRLTPQELHQITIGPPTINFGEVCLKSTSIKYMDIVNNLRQYIHVVVDIDCRELRQTSPLSQVIPPNSKAQLPLIFESNTKGRFQRNVTYTVNACHQDHVIVFAEVVPVALQLSSNLLTLKPTPGMPAEAGLRDVITLKNKRNYPADFTWQPILGERGTAFSIRPATGTVDAFKDLECEVVFHPSYHAPEDGQFALQVHGGSTLKLNCTANLGPTQVQFIERRILFGSVPLHLTTTRTAQLYNTSQNHAYFQVIDSTPFPGLSVTPTHGVVPVGGIAEIKVQLTPTAVLKFDTRVQIAIRGWKTIDLRMGGTVEPPVVDIDMPSFRLGGVYCGSKMIVPFQLINKAQTRAKVEFDLSRYTDFSLKFHGDVMEESEDSQNPGVYKVTVGGEDVIKCELTFQPSEVAAYDFIIPVSINQTEAPTPNPTPFPPTPAPSSKSINHIITPRPVAVTIATPRRRIIATGLRQPLQLSHTKLDFSLPSGFFEMGVQQGLYGQSKGTMMVNNSDKELKWNIDFRGSNKALEEGVFRFLQSNGKPFAETEDELNVGGYLKPGETYALGILFCPGAPGCYETKATLIINDDYDKPYRHLHLIGELKAPNLKFDPLAIVLTPVPLCTEISEEFSIHASGFRKETVIDVDLPDIEMDDGSTLSVLSVTFPEGQTIQPCCADDGDEEPFILKCHVTFSSPKPVSFTHPITFLDSSGHSFSIPVTATADNCLLTAYPFIAKHRADHQIVTEQGKSVKGRRSQSKESLNVGEAVIMPVDSPTRPSTRASTSSTSRFVSTTSTYEDSSASVTESTYPSTPRDGAANHLAMDAEMEGNSRQDLASRSLGSAAFPNEDTEEGLFHQEVLMAVQRWITLQGWPGGPNPVTIPDGLRSGVTRNSLGEAAADKPPRGVDAGSGSSHKKGLSRTVYDLVAHLTGKAVPGIPINQPLPADATERVLQLHWQHSTLLTFLRGQGASVAFIKPEYLLGPKDYRRWVKLQEHIKSQKRERESRQKAKIEIEVTESVLDEALFESVSKRAWTDLILQILKVLLLARITPRQFRTMPSPGSVALPTINPNPTCSNVYSVGERILLSWLNHHYEQQRHVIWKDCGKGGVPPSRWIVNFDFDLLDGLVLAAVLAAHIPFLAKSHLDEMYTFPNTAEQCLHNTLKVVSAFKCIGLDYDIQAIDITDPNPVALLFLCAHLYQRLPHYIPKASVEFIGTLHSSVLRQVRLTNPSNKSLIYHASISGRDARDFNLPRGDQVTISPRGKSDLPVEFTSRYLRPAEAYLVLVGRRAGSATAATMVFTLRTAVDNIEPLHVYKIENPCYELYKVMINVNNPFDEAGEFRVVMVESSSNFPMSDNNAKSGFLKSKPTEAKKVKSKIDHGQRKERAPSPPKADDVAVKMNTTLEGDKGNQLSYFFCSQSLVHLSLNESATVEVEFLPFNPGHRQCSILLINEKIGEFLYSIEAIATLPSPSMVPYRPSPSSVRISSAAAAGSGRGIYGGDERIIYWRCETNNTLQEEIHIPIANKARENALVIAAQQRMSSKEIERRKITGTLSSSSVTAAIAKLELASSSREDILTKFKSPATLANKDTKSKVFEVELSSKFFSAPATVTLTLPSKTRVQTVREGGGEMSSPTQKSSAGLVLEEGAVPLAIKFVPKGSGHYPCRVTLRAPNDIRVYQIECTVNPEGTAAEIEFTAPVHQSITQEIPIVNQTPHDWPLQASIEGFGFHGPPYILAKAMQTSYYPLMFRPSLESYSSGKLVLHNVDNNTDHIFHLQGLGQKPLALDHITLQCQARQVVTQTIKVPNVTSNKMVYRAVSDLNIITGPPVMTVLPGQEEDYTLMASAWKRGTFKGILSFIAGGTANLNDADSDGEDASRPESSRSGQSNQSAQSNASKASTSSKTKKKSSKDKVARRQGYRVWYSVEIVSQPPPPENTLEITCAAQSAAVMEVSISNPTVNDLTFDVIVEGEGLSGSESMSLTPAQRTMYQLTYAPAVVGEFTGSLIFQNEQVGEFWYNLKLIAETPAPVVLPHMECELGKWTRQYIELSNPTEETLQLTPSNTNPNNFTLEIDMDRKIVLAPHSSINIPLQFMPSCLGQGDHAAKIAFTCPQLGDLVYMSSGNGLTPRPVDPVSISASLGANTSLIIPFRNPMDQTVLVDVILSDNKDVITGVNAGLDKNIVQSDSAFCLLLKNPSNIPVPAKTNIDIPLTFAPDNMNLHEALLIISVRKEDGSSWEYLPSSQPDHPCARRDTDRRDATGGLKDIRWLYPIHGIPESHPVSDSNVAVIECQTRSRIEERLEAILMGAVPSSASGYQAMKTRALTPKDSSRPSSSDGVVVGEGNTLAEEFSYEILYDDDESKATLGNSIALSLLRKQRDKSNGIMTLIFNIVFAPFKVMHYDVNLRITAATGGVWTFPVRFVSTEPIADDVITIEAAGLNKTSAVGFRLTSQARHPVAFNAYFVAGSDAEFSVSPQSGELLPLGTNGSLLSVSFTPRIYGKTYIGKLVVQTADMQWTYDVQGITPSYTPPTGQSERPIAGPHPFPKYRRRPVNYVRENLKLTTTAISSPVKGAQVLRSRQVFT